MRVDLPEPEAPMIAVNDRRWNSTLMPRSASTAVGPSPKRRTSSWPATTGASSIVGWATRALPASMLGCIMPIDDETCGLALL
jgi:hypothetical protein